MSIKSKKIIVTGGCGYIGVKLVEHFLKKKFKVTVIDTQWFGKNLKKNKNLKIIKKDIRDLKEKHFRNIYAVFHLANIANDPAVELKPELSWEVNVLSSMKIIEFCIKNKVKKFFFASSGSVYGIKKEKKVTESLSLEPISVYNKTKMIAERIFLSYEKKIKLYIVRPATVCGVSTRQRLDVSVNALTISALKNNVINVFGGQQIRPNIHIDDMVNVYDHLFFKNCPSGIYNAGFENYSIKKIANSVAKITKAKIKIKKTNDPRSYRIDSSKLLNTGFKPNKNIFNAIFEIKKKYEKNKKFFDKKNAYTVLWMKQKKII